MIRLNTIGTFDISNCDLVPFRHLVTLLENGKHKTIDDKAFDNYAW